jgi:superoxide dismutase, Cu-Zn family
MKTKKKFLQLSAIVLVLAFITACQPQQGTNQAMQISKVNKAVCVLHPVNGSMVAGVITFTKVANGIRIEGNVTGLTPGKHGFHVHEWGNCTSADGKSAGGHFNPDNKKHGAPTDAERHVGDLGNIVADSTGTAYYDYTDNVISFEGKHSIIGRSIIVHAGEDDLTSQPTGNAGARVACGVIGIAGEE